MTWTFKPPTQEERIRREFENFFHYAHKVYPEQNIQVSKAIDAFVEMEKHLLRQIDYYQKLILDYENTRSVSTYLIDKKQDL